MIHRTELGRHALYVPCDLDGNIPLPGDQPHQFRWSPQSRWEDDGSWNRMVSNNAKWVARLKKELAEERRGGPNR